MKAQELDIKKIKVGSRFREEMGDVDSLAADIQKRGIIQPLSVDQAYNLLAGERRFRAATQIGLKKVPVVIHEVKGEIDSREIELIENTLRKDFTWVERANLEQRLFQLKQKEDPSWTQRDQAELMDHSVGTAARRLQLAEVMEAVPELADCKTEDEAWKKLKRLEEDIITQSLISEADPIYQKASKNARGHYMIGDALVGLSKLNAEAMGFIEVDPPYAVQLHKRKDRNQQLHQMDMYNEVDADDYELFVQQVATECFRVLQPNAFMVWWFGPQWYAPVLRILREVGFKVNDIPAIWTKDISGQTASPDTMLGSSYEPFFVCRKGMPKLRKPGRSNDFRFDPVAPQHKVHPTERPLALMQEIMETFVYPSQVVCVPFLGSGVTVRAAYLNKCVGFGWDLDELCKERFVNSVYKDMVAGGDDE